MSGQLRLISLTFSGIIVSATNKTDIIKNISGVDKSKPPSKVGKYWPLTTKKPTMAPYNVPSKVTIVSVLVAFVSILEMEFFINS